MNSALVLTPVLLFIPLLCFILPVLSRLLRPCRVPELTLEWYESFSVSSYAAMQGLLASDDFDFILRQPGFDPSIIKKLRRDRLRIFRQYLNRLIVDFNRLHLLARVVVSENSVDQSELLGKLLSLRVYFCFAVLQVEFSYWMCRLGIHTVTANGVIQQLEAMSMQLSGMPVSKASLAH